MVRSKATDAKGIVMTLMDQVNGQWCPGCVEDEGIMKMVFDLTLTG